MKDPARIPRVLAKLQHLWERHPHIRFGQLVSKVIELDRIRGGATQESDSDQYFLEDTDFERMLDTELAKNN